MKQFRVGDYVEVKENSCGYIKGDIGKIVKVGDHQDWIVFVPNRNSISDLKPNVAFLTSELNYSTEEAYKAQHGITKKYDYDLEAVHCTTQEQWDFVINKVNHHEDAKKCFSKKCFSGKGVYDTLGLSEKGWASLEFYKYRCSDLKVYTFQEWCEKLGHVFKNKSKFEVGKWYKHFAFEGTYAKFKELKYNKFNGDEWINDSGTYYKEEFKSSHFDNAKEVTLEEIQQYLPEGHPDKIVKSSEMTGEELLEEARRRYPIGTVVQSCVKGYPDMTICEHTCDVKSNSYEVWFDAGLYNVMVYNHGKWAKIISGTEVFKVEWIPKVGDWVVGWHDSEPNLYREAWKIKEVRGGLAYPEGKQGWCTGVNNIRKAELCEIPKECFSSTKLKKKELTNQIGTVVKNQKVEISLVKKKKSKLIIK